ncbi:MAG TPA: ergothioneine biosynthesis glutamate--cysteine ligase EgtA [Acidimicrobiales bacterium]|nr:ergothioneine biosynthesis glutamate--cysteine ligase EgtA [Acidimicrobiales bacterium]
MPAPRRSLTPADVHDFVRRHCFGGDETPPPGVARVGVEVELLTHPADDPGSRPRAADLLDALAAVELPGQAAITLEPGGQVEISSRPHPGAAAAIEATAADLSSLRAGLAAAGVETAAVGLDPGRPHRRVVSGPRYDAMEAFFDAGGAVGRAMMCGTASVQVNLDLGDPAMLARRWRLAHAVGPVLVAAFANSPLAGGQPTGARSSRQQIWAALDPTRSSPVAEVRAPQSLTPPDTWARYALAADVMLIRAAPDRFTPLAGGLPFAAWLGDGHELGYPTLDDFAYHLTTLFPPVRPKGWLELRMIDAVPDPWWMVAVAVVVALLDDPAAFDVAERACAPVADSWADAAAHGLAHPGLASAARTCFAAALAAMPGLGVDPATIRAGEAFVERYVNRARCPGDDLLDAWAAGDAPSFVAAGSG